MSHDVGQLTEYEPPIYHPMYENEGHSPECNASSWSTQEFRLPTVLPGGHRIRGREDGLQSKFYASNVSPSGEIFDFSLTIANLHSVVSLSLVDQSVSVIGTSADPMMMNGSVLGGSAIAVGEDDFFLLSEDYQRVFHLDKDIGQWSNFLLSDHRPGKRLDPSVTSFKSRLFFLCGLDLSQKNYKTLSDIWELDVSSRAFGGGKGGDLYDDTWEFDLQTRAWRNLNCIGDIPEARRLHHAVLIDDIMYVFGGLGAESAHFADLFALKVSESRWIYLRTFSYLPPDPTYSGFMATWASKLYIFSGWHSGERKWSTVLMSKELHATNVAHILDTRSAVDPSSGYLLHPSPSTDSLDSSIARLFLTTEDSRFIDFLHDGSSVGGGGFCDMYQGIHRPSGVKLALKRPRTLEKYGGPSDALRRFRREAEMWSTFDHANILPFFGLVEIKNDIYMTSPWMEQGDLSRFLDRRSQSYQKAESSGSIGLIDHAYTSFDEGITILEIASGIAYLHSINYVHGDIKAQNVLLTLDGHALLCDFGLTKFSGGATTTAMIGVGSFRWRAPELLIDESKSPASDVYAFAMTIVEILTGKIPFPDLHDLAVFMEVFHQEGRPPMIPLVHQGRDFTLLWRLASHCWRAQPQDRPTMAEALAALELLAA